TRTSPRRSACSWSSACFSSPAGNGSWNGGTDDPDRVPPRGRGPAPRRGRPDQAAPPLVVAHGRAQPRRDRLPLPLLLHDRRLVAGAVGHVADRPSAESGP